jgi:hypothetical protein
MLPLRNFFEGPIAKLLDIACIAVDCREYMMAQGRGLKDFEAARG